MEKNTKNAVFVQRLCAYVIDFLIISFVAALVAMPFMNIDSLNKIDSDMNNLANELRTQEIDYKTYLTESAVLSYETAKQDGVLVLITIFLEIIYFIVYQFYKGGQTIGKKFCKIKVISNDGELTMNKLIVRSLLINTILLQLIQIIIVSVVKNPMNYFYFQGSFECIQYIFMIICILMIMFRKDRVSLHDLITNTRVVKI